ncbi:MAG: hypothetical protein H6625_02960 [Bdellovibrionaceae bacterium]|nr:hypothetical protein [Pseudobdellovibrionaceae bacterium]
MKLVNFVIAAFLVLGFANAQAATQDQEEKEVQVSINDALVPASVKVGSEVKAVISGLFNNGCYRYSRSSVDHDTANDIHEVSTYAQVSQGMCIMVLVPFTREVELGSFTKGEHRVRFVNGDGTYMEKRIIAQ